MIERRLTYRKEVLLVDEIPPIPNVNRTRDELAKSPEYKATKSMIPKRINSILVAKSREIRRGSSPDKLSKISRNVPSPYLDSNHDFGFYNRPKRRQSNTITKLTEQLQETKRLLDSLKKGDALPDEPQLPSKRLPVRRRIRLDKPEGKPERKVEDFVSGETLESGSSGMLSISHEYGNEFEIVSSYKEEDGPEDTGLGDMEEMHQR